MFDFSGDEGFCLFTAGIIALSGALAFYRPLFSISLLGKSAARRAILAGIPPALIAITAIVINRWADPQVAGHADYELLFLVVNAAWLTLISIGLRIMGISIRDDVIDRDNPAAMIAASGLLASASFIYALANVGGGPTIWTTIVPSLSATLALGVVVLLTEFIGGRVFDSITIDRDVASALRISGAWIGCSVILGRAAGGTWISTTTSFVDLERFGWPVILVAVIAGLVHRWARPSISRPRPGLFLAGVIPAVLFVLLGIVAVGFTPHNFHPSQW